MSRIFTGRHEKLGFLGVKKSRAKVRESERVNSVAVE